MDLTRGDLVVGKTYRAKRHREFLGSTNDRVIVWLSGDQVQYDSDTVRMGRHLPMVTVDQFLRWAECIVEDDRVRDWR